MAMMMMMGAEVVCSQPCRCERSTSTGVPGLLVQLLFSEYMQGHTHVPGKISRILPNT
jgi:hypothetical protein